MTYRIAGILAVAAAFTLTIGAGCDKKGAQQAAPAKVAKPQAPKTADNAEPVAEKVEAITESEGVAAKVEAITESEGVAAKAAPKAEQGAKVAEAKVAQAEPTTSEAPAEGCGHKAALAALAAKKPEGCGESCAGGAECAGKGKPEGCGADCAGGAECAEKKAQKIAAAAAAKTSEPAADEPPACGSVAAQLAKAEGDDAPAGGDKHFGAVFTLDKNEPLATVLARDAKQLTGQTVQLTGKIDRVCKKKGCWMTLNDGKNVARVVFKDYGFTVPINSQGKTAIVEGTVEVKTYQEKMVKHLAEDDGKDPAKVSGTRTEYVVTAAAVTIKG